MAKIHIHRRNLSATDANNLRTLLVDAGCQNGEIDVIDHIDPPEEDSDQELVLTVLSPDVLTDPGLEASLLSTINGGRRAIGIWPKNSEQERIPAAVLKYCFSVVPWDSERIRAVVAGEDCICFETPHGEPLETPPEEHRVCPKL